MDNPTPLRMVFCAVSHIDSFDYRTILCGKQNMKDTSYLWRQMIVIHWLYILCYYHVCN